ncbi:MAG: type 4a pilus biogenesis protein PilO [Oligoflexia bacterium]|nr:type 4a pilus biogenesis protein PilO [Oligoflexia bacterium]
MGNRFKDMLEKLEWKHVVLIVVAAAALSYFTIDTSEIESREQSLAVSTQEIGNLERKIQEAKEFERQYDEKLKRIKMLVEELKKIQGALPKQFFLPDLLSDLLKEAKQLELEITSIRPDEKETPGDLYNSLGFSIQVKGTFLQFFIFMDRMANKMERLVDVASFRIDRDSAPGREAITLGGLNGAFVNTKLGGGLQVYPGITADLRVITYRYVGSSAATTEGEEKK